ncbi:MAG: hypothetical protein CVV21_00950 [Candidatus Goldiibacteriota bacterium HGW-Goldbacteria-1]|jgi:ABC-2 type transport system permease protein|nr:MAG: hypothetical protein CVV21_00950 [Candidatus Goldiibacteriota bacterium HGW-Goldbacteria-1]
MREIALLSGFYFTQFKNKFKHPVKGDLVKFFLLIVFSLVFFPMIYQLFFFIFKHFYGAQLIGGLLVNRLLSAIYMTFSYMIVMSAVVSAIPVLYLSRDMDFLFSSPIKAEDIFTFQYLKIIFEACWMMLLMSIPVFAAYSTVLKIDFYQYLFIMAAHIPFFIVMASAGITLTLVLVRYFPAESIRNIAIAMSGIFLVGIVLYFRMLEPEKLSAGSMQDVSEFLKYLRTPESFFLPHTHFISIVKDVTAYGIYRGIGPLLAYGSAAILIFALVIKAAGLWYFDGYGKKGIYKKEKPLAAGRAFTRRKVFESQLIKDVKYLVRDTSQWIQVVFLFGVVVIYLFNMYKMPSELFDLKNVIYFLNIGFIGFIISAIGSRFILPVISVEGRAFWIYRSAPTTMTKYVIDKFIAYGIPMMIIGLVIALLSIRILKSDPFINYVTIFSTVCVTLVISGVGTGFGGYFANFKIKNAEEMITGVAGLSYMFVTMVFIGITLALVADPVRDYYRSTLVRAIVFNPREYIWLFAAAFVSSVAITVFSLWAGINRLKKMEI